MASILNIFWKLFKRRQHQRYAIKSGTFVIISPGKGNDPEQRVQLIDISHGGMAFIYDGPSSELSTSGILKLITKTSQAHKINFDTVSDVSIPGCTQTLEPFRRRGVKFRWMGMYEQSDLEDFINTIGICKK